MRIRSDLEYVSTMLRRHAVNIPYFGLPYAVQMEVTTKCNLKCEMCIRSKEQAGVVDSDMSLELFDSIISKLRYPTRHVIFVGIGEPLLNPQIYSMIRSVKRKGFRVSLISNFTLINQNESRALIDSGLDFLFVSFDSTVKSIFEKIRTGASFEKVIDNIKLFVRIKKEVKAETPAFFFKTTISRRNSQEIGQLIKLADTLGVDGIDFGKLFSDEEEDYIHDPSVLLNVEDLKESRIIIDSGKLSRSCKCDAITNVYVTFDGKVLPCPIINQTVPRSQYPQFQFGDLRVHTIGKIWRSTEYRQFRKQIRSKSSQPPLPICKECQAWMFH